MNIAEKNIIYNHKSITGGKDHPHFSMKHSHSTYEIIFFEQGDADYVVEDRRYKLKKNDLVFTRPFAYHYIEVLSDSAYSRFDVAFDSTFIDEKYMRMIPENIDAVNCSEMGIIAENFRRMKYYSERFGKDDFLELVRSLLKEILYNLSVTAQEEIYASYEISPIITRALKYIESNLFKIKSVDEICDKLALSEPYFFRLFKNELKTTPKQYINHKRLQHAQNLIRLGRKPSEAYLECGFETYVGFYKQYVKTFGYSPSQEKESRK